MKRILYYSDCYIFGGCEKLLVSLFTSAEINARYDVHYAYALNRDYQRGVDCHVPLTVRRHPLRILDNHNLFYRIDRSSMKGVTKVCIKVPFALLDRAGLYACYNFLRLLLFIRAMKPDLIHINNGGYPAARSCRAAVAAARVARVPRIVFAVNNLAQSQKNVFERFIDRFIDRCVDRFVTGSALAGKLLFERRRFSRDKVAQIYNGVAEGTVCKGRAELLSEFGQSPEKFVIVNVALLTERKGQMCLIEALIEVRRRCSEIFENLVIFLVGEGEDRARIEDFLSRSGLTAKVVLTGHRADFFDFIHSADLFVHPALRDEDMPLAILSAMNSGKAIIATRVAGIVEQIRDRIDGVLLDPGDPAALAGAIVAFYGDRERMVACGAHARQRFYDCFTLEKFVENYQALYEELLHG